MLYIALKQKSWRDVAFVASQKMDGIASMDVVCIASQNMAGIASMGEASNSGQSTVYCSGGTAGVGSPKGAA